MVKTEKFLKQLRKSCLRLSRTKRYGTVAVVDLVGSTKFKSTYQSAEMWLERLSNFLTIVTSVGKEILKPQFIKFLGDGVLLFSKESKTNPKRFIDFAEVVAERIRLLNSSESKYSSKEFAIKFTLALDYGPDIFLLHGGDPQGIVIDRVFRISSYLMPNMIGASAPFYDYLKNTEYSKKITLAGKAYLKGISESWQEIYALTTLENFSTQLSPEQKKKEALIDIWEMGEKDRPIWVISGAIHSESDIDIDAYSVQHGDSNALIEVIHILDKLYPDRPIEIVTSEDYLKRNSSSFDNDIVSVSGPYYNLVSQRVINKVGLPINFELEPEKLNEYEDPILTFFEPDGNKLEFKSERDDSRISSDIAVFVKMKDAFAKDRFFYLIMGNQTQGTYAAARLFGISSPCLLNNYKYLKNKFIKFGSNASGFGIIARAPIINDYVEPIELESAKDLKTFTLPLDYKISSIQKGPKGTV